MVGVRIKDLQDAKSVIEKLDDMQFTVDSGNPDTTMKLSGKDLKTVIGMPKHTHAIEQITGLPGVLEKKMDTMCGTITVICAWRATLMSKTCGWTSTSKCHN